LSCRLNQSLSRAAAAAVVVVVVVVVVVRVCYTVGGKMSDKNLEQPINIKFCVKIGKSDNGPEGALHGNQPDQLSGFTGLH
jgi:hypothetical protein